MDYSPRIPHVFKYEWVIRLISDAPSSKGPFLIHQWKLSLPRLSSQQHLTGLC